VAGRIVIGTSSWAGPGFVDEWYPEGLPSEERLPWYAERFEGVELNASFYAVPQRDTVARWAEVTPEGFSFDVKLHRLLSQHVAPPDALPPELRADVEVNPRGLVVVTDELQRALVRVLLDAVAPLEQAGKLSSFLLQLSPQFAPRRHQLGELDVVLDALSPHRVAVELRHRAWTRRDRLERTLGYLERRNAAWVGVDAEADGQITIMPPIDAVTSRDLAYLRLHRPGRQSDEQLRGILQRAQRLARDAHEVRVMAGGTGADAPRTAQRLRELLGQVAPAAEQLRLAG
jgi:uncharacterized protein YecE (DUF72 family)